MKKIFKKIAIIGALSFVGTTSFTNTIYASSTKAVLKYYKLDLNLYTMAQTIFDEQYSVVPDTAAYYSNSKVQIGSGWNYTRYQFTNYYKDHQSIL